MVCIGNGSGSRIMRIRGDGFGTMIMEIEPDVTASGLGLWEMNLILQLRQQDCGFGSRILRCLMNHGLGIRITSSAVGLRGV